MVSVSTSEKFIFGYSVFLFFITFMISLGYSGFGGNIGQLTPPQLPNIPEANILDVLIGMFLYVIDNIGFFFLLMSVDTGIAFLGIVLFSPAIIVITYIVLKLIRGGG